MLNDDLEAGKLSATVTSGKAPSSPLGFESLESGNFHANGIRYQPVNERIDGQVYDVEDDLISGVPRRKVEQLLKLWIEVFQHSLGAGTHQNAKSASSAVVPPARGHKTPYPHDPNGDVSLSSITNNPPNDTVRDPVWAKQIDIIGENQIETENKSRRSVRQEWRTDEKMLYLEDSWEHLWESKPGVDTGLFQWSYSEENRKSLQLDLVDALNAQSELVTVRLYMRRDYRSIASWVSLIGLRLNEMNRSIYDKPRITPATQIKILIECLWCCNSYSSNVGLRRPVQGPTVGDVLTSCYRRRVLVQQVDGSSRELEIREHFWYVRRALYLLNILYKHRLPHLEPREDIDRTWRMPLSMLEASLREVTSETGSDGQKDAFFNLDDFNLKDLQSLGHIRLRWTCYWDEHLQLETSSVGNTLKVYWFQPSLARYFFEK